MTKAFCARPGCGIARAVHGRIGCAGYIAPTSDAGRAIVRAEESRRKAFALALVETPPPSVDVPTYVEFDVEETTVVERPKTIAQIAAEWSAELDPASDEDLLADFQTFGGSR